MSKPKLPMQVNDAVHWFMGDLTSRIVAESGRPSDRYHMGKILLQSLKDNPDFVLQIDGATGDEETSGSVLQRSVRCAIAMKNFGLRRGDLIILMAPNHIDLVIPFYAALYLGVIVAAVDRTLGVQELQGAFEVNRPKLIYCQSEKAPDVQLALKEMALDIDAQIISFDKGDYSFSLQEFLARYGDDTKVDDFRAEDFDPEDTIALLVATSGTTGLPKSAAATHKNLVVTGPYWWSKFSDFPRPITMALVVAPLQWMTALMVFMHSAILKFTKLHSSAPSTQDHVYELINKYRPTFAIISPTMMTTLLKEEGRNKCDFTSLKVFYLAGSAVSHDLIEDIKKATPESEVAIAYGMSELTCIGFHYDNAYPGACGKPMGCFQYRLVSIETQEDILEPNKPGELWIKGPGIFKEYYNNPAATVDTFAEGRWFKTGDLFYRDDNWNFYFVERIKLLLKYRNYQISPVEIEAVIREHPGVLDVAVTGIPDKECGELPVACIVLQSGANVTAQDIKDLVKDNLADTKQLRGGVIFLPEIPLSASTKIDRRKLKEIALTMDKE